MAHIDFFDLLHGSAFNDRLLALDAIMPSQKLGLAMEPVWTNSHPEGDLLANCKPRSAAVMFSTLVLRVIYNLHDDPIEKQIQGHLSLIHLLRLRLRLRFEAKELAPNTKTIWPYRTTPEPVDLIAALLGQFGFCFTRRGYF